MHNTSRPLQITAALVVSTVLLPGCGGGALSNKTGLGLNGGSSTAASTSTASSTASSTTSSSTSTTSTSSSTSSATSAASSTTNAIFIADVTNIDVGTQFEKGDRTPILGDTIIVTKNGSDLAIQPDPSDTMLFGKSYGSGTGLMSQTSPNEFQRAGTNSWARYFTTVTTPAGTQNLTNAAYGVYTYDHTGGLVAGGFHHGTPTSNAAMPTTGSASYRGSFTGVSFAEGGSVAASRTPLSGDVTMTYNFGVGSVAATIDNLQRAPTGVAPTPTGVKIELSGSQFGTNRYIFNDTVVRSTATGTSATTVTLTRGTGTFYGDNAAETAATVTVKTSSNPGLNSAGATAPSMVVGGFGAKKQ